MFGRKIVSHTNSSASVDEAVKTAKTKLGCPAYYTDDEVRIWMAGYCAGLDKMESQFSTLSSMINKL